MQDLLPFAILAVVVALFVGMPWGHPDPRHVFIFDLYERLARSASTDLRADAEKAASEESHNRVHRTAAGHPHGRSGPGV